MTVRHCEMYGKLSTLVSYYCLYILLLAALAGTWPRVNAEGVLDVTAETIKSSVKSPVVPNEDKEGDSHDEEIRRLQEELSRLRELAESQKFELGGQKTTPIEEESKSEKQQAEEEEEKGRQAEEEKKRRQAEEEEEKRRQAEEEKKRRQAEEEEEKRRQAEEEKKRRQAEEEEEKRRQAEEEMKRRQAEEEEEKRRQAEEEEEKRRQAEEEEEKRRQAEEEKKRRQAEEEKKRRQAEEEEEKRRQAEEEKKRRQAEEEEEKRRQAEEEKKRRQAEEEKKRRQAEEEKKRRQAEEEEKKRRQAEEEERRRQAEEEEEKRRQEERKERIRQLEEEERRQQSEEEEDKRRRQAEVDAQESLREQYSKNSKDALFLRLLISQTDELEKSVAAVKGQARYSCLSNGEVSSECRDAFSDLNAAVSRLTFTVSALGENMNLDYGRGGGVTTLEDDMIWLGGYTGANNDVTPVDLGSMWTWVATVALIVGVSMVRKVWGFSNKMNKDKEVPNHGEKQKEDDHNAISGTMGAETSNKSAASKGILSQGVEAPGAKGLVRRSPTVSTETKTLPSVTAKQPTSGPSMPGMGAKPTAFQPGPPPAQRPPAQNNIMGVMSSQPPPVPLSMSLNSSYNTSPSARLSPPGMGTAATAFQPVPTLSQQGLLGAVSSQLSSSMSLNSSRNAPSPLRTSLTGPGTAPSPFQSGSTLPQQGPMGTMPSQLQPPFSLNSSRTTVPPQGRSPNRLNHSISNAENSVVIETSREEGTEFLGELRNPFLQRWS